MSGEQAPTNAVLDALAHSTELEEVELALGQRLYEQSGPIEYVYFPTSCLISVIAMVGDDKGVEVGLVAGEGMVGLEAAVGMPVAGFCAIVQGAGTARRMKVSALRAEMRHNPLLQNALLAVAYSMMRQAGQTAACNQHHRVDERLARWLLMIRDRVRSSRFKLTHEFASRMLGVRRVGVTIAAGKLQRQGLIRYSRGDVEILDQAGLVEASCACYRSPMAVGTQPVDAARAAASMATL
jgi:CRP-like cAMP-binding protein